MTDWNKLATDSEIENTVSNLEKRGVEAIVVNTKEEALAKVIEMLPEGGELMTGTSTTLNQIGFSDYLGSQESKFNNVSASIWSENDADKRTTLRRKAVASDNFVTSVNAISQNGEIVAVDNSGSRVSSLPFGAGKVVIIAGTNKIAPNLESAMQRIREHVYPLENERAKVAYGTGSNMSKWVIIEKEVHPGRITVIFVKEELGF